jgi:hypothetical protein
MGGKQMNIDILSIHANILQYFNENTSSTAETIASRKEYVVELKKHLSGNALSVSTVAKLENEINVLETELEQTETHSLHHYYLLYSLPLIDQYKKLCDRKVQYFFHTDKTNTDAESVHTTKMNIIKHYLKNVRKLFSECSFYSTLFSCDTILIDDHPSSKTNDVENTLRRIHTCQHCNAAGCSIDVFDNQSVCQECGAVLDQYAHQVTSYKDIERVNMNAKYTYDRRTHFRDCLLQYQGKQNVTIAESVYTTLVEKLVSYALIPSDYEHLPQNIVFEKVTKEHVILFLKDMKCVKHYEDHVLIYKNLTGKEVPDLSVLEEDLLHDFDELVECYDRRFKNTTERKNFINTQYVLFQLLRRHKYPCNKEDFNILKTVDRKYYHDEICSELFHDLGWNFQPIF